MPVPHEKAVLAVGQSIQAAQMFATVNPSIFTIRHPDFAAHDGTVGDIRDGERIATAIVVGSGVVLAFLMESTAALWTAFLASIIMIAIYEWALATRHAPAPEPEA